MIRFLTFVTVTASLLLLSCDQNMPAQNDPTLASHSPQLLQDRNIKIVPFSESLRNSALSKVVTVSSFVSYDEGGELELDYDYDFEVDIKFEVPQHSISEDAMLKLTIDTDNFVGSFDVNFQPHGIVFDIPACLNIKAKNLDLSSITDPSSIKVYYDNTKTGEWEEMQCDDIVVNLLLGNITVINASIPHFSRYAIGTEY